MISCLFDKYKDIKVTIVSIILTVMLFILLIVVLFIKFEFNHSYIGVVRMEDDSYVYLLVNDTDIPKISTKKIFLDKKYYEYKIIKIDGDYTLTENGPKRGLYIKFDLDDSYKINNNVIPIKFIFKKTIFERFKELL